MRGAGPGDGEGQEWQRPPQEPLLPWLTFQRFGSPGRSLLGVSVQESRGVLPRAGSRGGHPPGRQWPFPREKVETGRIAPKGRFVHAGEGRGPGTPAQKRLGSETCAWGNSGTRWGAGPAGVGVGRAGRGFPTWGWGLRRALGQVPPAKCDRAPKVKDLGPHTPRWRLPSFPPSRPSGLVWDTSTSAQLPRPWHLLPTSQFFSGSNPKGLWHTAFQTRFFPFLSWSTVPAPSLSVSLSSRTGILLAGEGSLPNAAVPPAGGPPAP